MKDVSDVVACIVDYGTFISLAEKLAETYKKVYYHSPFQEEYLDARKCVIGDGIQSVERLDEWMDPEKIKEIDLFIFPDIGYGGEQRLLRSMGKAVWGSMGASDLELYRTRFLKVLKDLDLPVVNYVTKQGLTNLSNHLRTVKNKWIKINRFRANMETWKHIDYDHSVRELERMAIEFGGVKERVTFVVQDEIDTEIEIGYDGWSIGGRFPSKTFQGYEKKNELYLGCWLEYENLPEEVRFVNGMFAPVLEEYGYQNFFATELRVKDKVPNFIDPTLRMPGQTGEHLTNTCTNLPEVIWRGANGQLISPDFRSRFAMEATIHCTSGCNDNWRSLRIPEEAIPFCKMYHFCIVDGIHHFPPLRNDEVGVIVGEGDSIQEAKDNLDENFELLKDEPLCIHTEGFVEIINSINEAEDEGIEFTDQEVPEPQDILT